MCTALTGPAETNGHGRVCKGRIRNKTRQAGRVGPAWNGPEDASNVPPWGRGWCHYGGPRGISNARVGCRSIETKLPPQSTGDSHRGAKPARTRQQPPAPQVFSFSPAPLYRQCVYKAVDKAVDNTLDINFASTRTIGNHFP